MVAGCRRQAFTGRRTHPGPPHMFHGSSGELFTHGTGGVSFLHGAICPFPAWSPATYFHPEPSRSRPVPWPPRPPSVRLRWRRACVHERSTSTWAKATCWDRASSCVGPSRPTGCSRSSCSARRARGKPRWPISLRPRPAADSSASVVWNPTWHGEHRPAHTAVRG